MEVTHLNSFCLFQKIRIIAYTIAVVYTGFFEIAFYSLEIQKSVFTIYTSIKVFGEYGEAWQEEVPVEREQVIGEK
jgi:hypothetical protein